MSMPAKTTTSPPLLADLLAGFADAPPVPVSDIAIDTRRLGHGALFLACRGSRSHALEHLDEVTARKLAAVAWDGDAAVAPPDGVPAVAVPGLAGRLGEIANRFFDSPSRDVAASGVTGTNGKTTVAWLLAQSRQRLGQPCGYVGTLGAGLDEVSPDTGLTTPDCVELNRQLARFRDGGARHAALEVSSHALVQERLSGIRIATAIFTNLSRDHIDYHGDLEAYGEAKARLFHELEPRERVICTDSPFGVELASRFGREAVVVSATGRDTGHERYVTAGGMRAAGHGMEVAVRSSWGDGRATLPLFGSFNVANALTVLGVLLADGIAFADGLELLAGMAPPPGRLQPVDVGGTGRLPQVFVDYAHTPAALEAALGALRPHASGALWCVFGCGGDRDRGKRPEMGRAALSNADRVVLTSDNPRTEDPAAIMRDVQEGVAGEMVAIEDRAAAIAWAVANAAADDVVLIAGKGHEDYQVVGETRRPFSDFKAAAENLRRRAR